VYCSSCGGAGVQGLTYCNHCGAQLPGSQIARTKQTDSSVEALIWAIVGTFVGGMAIIIGLLAVMKNELHFDLGLLIFFSLLTFALMTAIEAVFVWMLFSRNRAANHPLELGQKPRTTKELDVAPARLLAEPIPLPSVTEEPTRSFEPTYERRK